MEHEFASVAEVEAGLQFLIDKYPPLVARLPVAPGASAARYGHLLSGELAIAQQESAAGFAGAVQAPAQGSRTAQLEAEVAALREQVAALAAQFEQFRKQFE